MQLIHVQHGMGLKFMGMGPNFMGMGMTHGVLVQGDGATEVLEAVFADVYLLQLGVLGRVGGREPGVHLVVPELHHLQTVLLAVGGVALGGALIRLSHMTQFSSWPGNKAINRTSRVLVTTCMYTCMHTVKGVINIERLINNRSEGVKPTRVSLILL